MTDAITSAAQMERLICLTEELAEAMQATTKAMRFGMDDHHPHSTQTNRDNLEQELGDLGAIIILMVLKGDLSHGNISERSEWKERDLKRWLRYQDQP